MSLFLLMFEVFHQIARSTKLSKTGCRSILFISQVVNFFSVFLRTTEKECAALKVLLVWFAHGGSTNGMFILVSCEDDFRSVDNAQTRTMNFR